MRKKEVIIGVTGSIAAYKACDVIGGLRRAGCNTTVVMTKEAAEFITPLTLGYVSANPVYRDMFEAPQAWNPRHISLAENADMVLIAPATANIIAKLANGICDDLLSSVVVSTKAVVLVAPAMNSNMWLHKTTQENVRRLKSLGYKFIGPVKGRLACGITGIGHIADTSDIVKTALGLL